MEEKTKKSSAFTLIELLVVIAIIGLLASIVLVSLNSARAKARDARRIDDLKQLQLAVEMYYADHGQYPEPANAGYGSTPSGHCPNFGNLDEYILGLVPEYLPSLPVDPRYDIGSQCYLYRSNMTDYSLWAHVSMESLCDGADGDTTKDPGDECNPAYIQQMDRTCCEQSTISLYSPGGRGW